MTRALCYVPDVSHQTWIESELALLGISVQTSWTVGQLVSALVEDPPPRPQILFADFRSMSAAELLHLHGIRELGWFGTVFAIGEASLALRHSMSIERVLEPPLSRGVLRAALLGTGHAETTVRMPRITG